MKKSSYLSNALNDFSGYCFYNLRKINLGIFKAIATCYLRIILRLKNIKFGKNTKFLGMTYFHRHPLSEIKIGDDCFFRSDRCSNLAGLNRKCMISTLTKNSRILIKNKVGLSGTVIGAAEYIEIGNNVICGANVFITDTNWHNTDPVKRRERDVDTKPVIIEDNVWIGINSVILKGVTIGKNSVIGANSVVVKSIPQNTIAAGNPCKPIKKIG